VSLIDGPTATRVERVAGAGRPDDHFSVTTVASSAWIVNRTQSQVRRVDGASLQLQPPVAGATVDDRFELVANPAATWEIVQDRSAVIEVDQNSGMAMGQLLPAPGAVETAAIAPDGTLWTTDERSPEVSSYRDGELQSRRAVRGGEGADVVIAGDTPVVIPRTGESAVALGVSGASELSLCAGITGAADLLLAGSEPGDKWVMAVNPTAGILTVADLESGECPSIALGVASSAPRYGPPVAHGHRVFVADTVAGTAIVVDPSKTDPVVARVDLDLPGKPFLLFAVNGFVWFDEPNGDTAGVITDDLRARIVSKAQGDGAPRDPIPDEGPDDKPEQRKQPQCVASPAQVVVGQAVELFVVKNDFDVSPDSWSWTVEGADFSNGNTGVQISATFATPGTFPATATGTTTDGEPAGCETAVSVVPLDTPRTTTTAPPTTVERLPATTLPDTVPETTTAQPDTATPTTPVPTQPGSTTAQTTAQTTAPPPTTVAPTATTTKPTTATTTPTTPATAPTTTPPAPTTAAPTTTLAVPQPDFTFQPSNPKAGDVVTFTDLTPGGPFTNTWTFQGADTPTGSGAMPTTVWSSTGTFTVTLTADNRGVAQSVSKMVTVGAAPAFNQVALTSVAPMGPVDCSAGTVDFTFAWTVDAVGPLQLSATFQRSDGSTGGPVPVPVADGVQSIPVQDVWRATVPTATALSGSNIIVITNAAGAEIFRGAQGDISATCLGTLTGYEVAIKDLLVPPSAVFSDSVSCPTNKVALSGGVSRAEIAIVSTNIDTFNIVGRGMVSVMDVQLYHQDTRDLDVRIWAVCVDPPAGYEIVRKSVPVLSVAWFRDVVSCPNNKVAVGGGAAPSTQGAELKESSSDIGTPSGTAWLVGARIFAIDPDVFRPWAVCIDRPPGFEVNRSDVAVPGFMKQTVSVPCQSGKVLLGGGAQLVAESQFGFPWFLYESAPDEGTSPIRPTAQLVNVANGDGSQHAVATTAVCASG
jgi:hypothetical protein